MLVQAGASPRQCLELPMRPAAGRGILPVAGTRQATVY